MKSPQISRNEGRCLLLFTVWLTTLSLIAKAQNDRLIKGEMAICRITTKDKTYILQPNQVGSFDRVFNLSPSQVVPIEVYYPKGQTGEKVVVVVEDGGNIDGKGVKVLPLGNQQKITFNFQVFDRGIHHITLKKGNDIKTIQLCGGRPPAKAFNVALGKENGQDPTGNDASGNLDSSGVDAPPQTCKQKQGQAEGGAFQPYTGNVSRAVRDLEVWGGTGDMALQWIRYGNSRTEAHVSFFGAGFEWNHSFNFNMADEGTNATGQRQVSIHYPQGGKEYFTQSSSNASKWLPARTITNRLFMDKNNFFLQMPNGYRYRFARLKNNNGKTYYQLQDFKDAYQNQYSLFYDSARRLDSITEPAGRYFKIIYGTVNGTNVITQVKTREGRTVRYHYSILKDNATEWTVLDTVYYGDGTHALYSYVVQSAAGEKPVMEHAIDPRLIGNDVNMKYAYDTTQNIVGFINQEINGVTGELMVSLSEVYRPRTETNQRLVCYANGNEVKISYPVNEDGNASDYVDGLGRKTHNTYDEKTGFLKTLNEPLGRVTTYGAVTIYDNPLKITQPDGSTVQWTRDSLDLILTHTDELGRVTTYTRDANHRVTRITYPDGSFETFTYNNFGQVLDHQTRNGGIEHSVYDSRGLRTSFTDALGNKTTYMYDGADRLASMTDARGNTSGYVYNERGLMTKMTNPDGTFKLYRYDEFGNRTTVTDELGHAWTTKYDEFRRPDSLIDPLGRKTLYSYDLPGGICGCTHEENKPTAITSPSGKTTTYTYDVEWQKLSETVGAGTPDAATTAYEYDAAGNLVTVTDPNGSDWTTTYNLRNWKKSSIDPLRNTTAWTYDKVGNITKITRPDGGVTSNTYDNMNRLTKTIDPNKQVINMKYDKEDNMITLIDPKNHAYNFLYDLLDRRIKMIYPDNSAEQYAYDKVSNLVVYINRSGNKRTYVYDKRNRETSSSWDDNLTPAVLHFYDAASRVIKITSSVSTMKYGYDAANELIKDTEIVAGLSGNNVHADEADHVRPEQIDHLFQCRRRAVQV